MSNEENMGFFVNTKEVGTDSLVSALSGILNKTEDERNYFIQTSAYCEMYEEQYGQPIDQIVILIVTEEGATQTFIKNKKDYLPLLEPAIKEFHRKFKENEK